MVSCLEILSVLEYDRPAIKMQVRGRPFNVISMRTRGEAHFSAGESTFEVKENNLLIVPKNTAYSQETKGESIVTIHIGGDLPFKGIQSVECGRIERELFFEICELYNKGTLHSVCMAHSKLYALFGRVILNEGYASERNIITEGYEIIRARFTDPSLKIETIAKDLNISSVYFRREFKKHYNMSPKEFLIDLRLDYASVLLKNNYCNVNEAAYQSGFSNPNYFSVSFKNKFDIPPLAYSKKDWW